MDSSEKKITLSADDETVEFFVLEETRIGGKNYLLVTDAKDEEEEGECYILKDMSKPEDTEAVYEFVEDDKEIDYLYTIFSELLDDADVEILK